ncbi:MAG TPA: hypothetical protein VHF27_07255 [Acidimicrobiales bacterium]|nr:hypothetical protein [Acidimicrobiales bacterium]
MSTFLVSFGVVAATIAAVVYVVLNGPDQPATIRRRPPDAKPRRARRAEARSRRQAQEATVAAAGVPQSGTAVTLPGTPAFALPDSDIMRLRVLPATRTTLWVRIRSGVALVVLVAVLGALLALAVGGLVLGVALLIRSATG